MFRIVNGAQSEISHTNRPLGVKFRNVKQEKKKKRPDFMKQSDFKVVMQQLMHMLQTHLKKKKKMK